MLFPDIQTLEGTCAKKAFFLNGSRESRIRQIETLPRDLALNSLRTRLNSALGRLPQRGGAITEHCPNSVREPSILFAPDSNPGRR
jgi:hypothetical protein